MSETSIDIPINEEKEDRQDKHKFKLLGKKKYAESSSNNSHNSFLEQAINVTATVANENKDIISNKEETVLVFSDLDANVDDNDEGSSTPSIPSIPKSSSSGSGSFIPMKCNLQKKNVIKQNQDNATPSYLLLMQYLENPGENQNKFNKRKNDGDYQNQIVFNLLN